MTRSKLWPPAPKPWDPYIASKAVSPAAVLFTLLLLLFANSAVAKSFVLNPNFAMMDLSPDVEYIEDQEQFLSIEQILKKGAELQWQTPKDHVINLGFSDANFWFHISLKNNNQKYSSWLLETNYAQIGNYTVFVVDEKSEVSAFYSGTELPIEQRYWQHRHFLTPLDLPFGQTAAIYILVQSQFAIQLPLRIWEKDAFVVADQKTLFIQSVFFGILAAMILYNIFLIRFALDVSYGYYVVFVIMIACFQLLQQGIAYQYFPLLVGHGGVVIVVVTSALALTFAYLFIDRLLELKSHSPWCHIAANIFAAAGIFFMLLAFLIPPIHAFPIMIYFIVPASFGALIIGLISWMKGVSAAPYFVVAWSIFLMGNVLLLLNRAGVLPRVPLTEYSQMIGTAIEVILLSLALADRINREREDKLKAQEIALTAEKHTLNVQKQAKRQLEEQVAERTTTLSTALGQLEIANQNLMEENISDPLTGIKNRRYFNQKLEEEWKRACRSETNISLLLIDLDHFKQLNDTHGHVFGDECLVEVAEVIQAHSRREEDLAARFGGEEFALVLPGCDKEIAITIAENIRKAVERLHPVNQDAQKIRIACSIGVATLKPHQDSNPVKLITEADKALYNAKDGGRNRIAG